MNTFQSQTTLKGHKFDIRALEFSKDGKYLYSAGHGGMLVWDLRNLGDPVEKIEERQDIFCLKSTQNMLYLGCRNHSIIPVGLSYQKLFADQVHPPLKPLHMDVVTSLTTLMDDQIMISASKDKNLKAWHTEDSSKLLPTL